MDAEAKGGRFTRIRTVASLVLRAALGLLVLCLVIYKPEGKDWPLDPSFFLPFTKVGKVVLFVVPLIATGWFLWAARLSKLLDRVPRWVIDLLLAVLAFYLARRTMMVATHGWPQVQDEIAFDRLARRMALGHPIPASHPLPEFFRLRFFVDDPQTGRSYPVFQPGWPMFLALFHRLHLPTLAPPFTTALFAIATSRFAERLYGRLAGLLAGLLLLASGFVVWLGASYFSHVFAAALYVFALERLVAALEADNAKSARNRALVAGLAAAWLLLTRIPTFVAFLAPALLVCLWAVERRPKGEGARLPAMLAKVPLRLRASARVPLLVFALATALGPLGQMGWNLATTRHAFVLPQDRYFDLTEPKPDCHRIGFGTEVGCPHEHPGEVPPEGYTFDRAIEVTRIRWAVFRDDVFGGAVALLACVLFVLLPLASNEAVLLAAILAPPVVYFGFYYHAIQHGARLWTELMGPLVVAMAWAVARPFAETSKTEKNEKNELGLVTWVRRLSFALGSTFALAILLVTAAFDIGQVIPERAKKNGEDPQPDRVQKNLDLANVHGAIVYIVNCIEADRADLVYGWPSVIETNPPESGDRWLARDFGPGHDRQLVNMYPDRKHVRVSCDGRPLQWDLKPTPRHVVIEIDGKFPPVHENAYGTVVKGKEGTEGTLFSVAFKQPGALVRFPQWIFVDASYRLTLRYLRRFDGGRFGVAVDGKLLEPPIDGRGSREARSWIANADIWLSQGNHQIELRNLEGPGTFIDDVDVMELVAN